MGGTTPVGQFGVGGRRQVLISVTQPGNSARKNEVEAIRAFLRVGRMSAVQRTRFGKDRDPTHFFPLTSDAQVLEKRLARLVIVAHGCGK